MRGLVVFESMYGNTHEVATAIGAGLALPDGVVVSPVHEVDAASLHDIDLLVVGGPTHVHGMSRPSTRKSAVEAAEKPGSGLDVEPDAAGDGLREWFETLGPLAAAAAAFDTRVDMPVVLSGRASKGIAKLLRQHRLRLLADPQSFLVDKHNHLLPGELERARAWGARIAAALAPSASGR